MSRETVQFRRLDDPVSFGLNARQATLVAPLLHYRSDPFKTDAGRLGDLARRGMQDAAPLWAALAVDFDPRPYLLPRVHVRSGAREKAIQRPLIA
jgi:hypothetical protein